MTSVSPVNAIKYIIQKKTHIKGILCSRDYKTGYCVHSYFAIKISIYKAQYVLKNKFNTLYWSEEIGGDG